MLADAIHYARDGFPVAPVFGAAWSRLGGRCCASVPTRRITCPAAKRPSVGQIVRLPGLARTLQAVADGGAEAFYTGPMADAIVATLQERGGVMTPDDLNAITARPGRRRSAPTIAA